MTVDDKRIDRLLDGELSDDEVGIVSQWLEVPANLERFARRAELHADLRSTLRRKRIQSTALQRNRDSRFDRALTMSAEPGTSNWRVSRTTLGLGTLALVTAACLLIAFMMPSGNTRPRSSRQYHASVISRIDAVLTRGGSNWDATGLVAGPYHLKKGLLHVSFDGGVMVYVEAPARFDAISGQRIVLHCGRLSANVPAEGIGFTVETPEAKVIDFGTEFSVDVESGASEVHVFEGLVRVQPRSRQGGEAGDAVDLRTSQAIKIEDTTVAPVGIEIARDRFIRNFDEPKRNYARSVKQLSPTAFYRMAIRDKGLVSEPPSYSGVVLMGDGIRPPHASGVFAGGSMRVRADSSGRGGRVPTPPMLIAGQFTLAVFVYLETPTHGGTVATNIRGDDGNFSLALDKNRRMQATIRTTNDDLQSVASDVLVPLQTWSHVVVTANGKSLQIYENGQLVASTRCSQMANSVSTPLWFGTNGDGLALWDGRIDELALFDTALSANDIAYLYQSALEEMARIE
ncbi:LamG-like jellyroll fold domain-containing protein [Novipirellula artificiosorum]|uniref:FecR protein n=1 Tax=Novipirellula artificiosorum TaxID=2528016 RepID=A0A5C6DRU4_9BACT|nr:LamG-like jellyroll fold domain-containing protein [Novipirellula artificiosorum]TWU38271.1 FecR protein [Novipirellula artificiosorum]